MKFNDKQYSVYSGKKLKVKVFGASHSKMIGVEVSGFNGERFCQQQLQEFCDRRRAVKSEYSTTRAELDKIVFLKGNKNGKVKGKIKAVIFNKDTRSSDYEKTKKIPRPAHADYVAWTKYGEGFDYRGGGKFSGRLTAPICIAGGIAKQILEQKGIKIQAFISSIHNVKGKTYSDVDMGWSDLSFSEPLFPTIDDSEKELMKSAIKSAREKGDSVGGKIDCVITGVPVGAGEYMFDSLESVISTLAFAVPAVKGIEFGSGFEITKMKGSEANDSFYYDNGVVKTKTNHNGGINGGIANGMPITFRVAIKPTPSIALEQDSVDLENKQNVKLKIQGRHDACIVPRAVPVIEAISALAIYEVLKGV